MNDDTYPLKCYGVMIVMCSSKTLDAERLPEPAHLFSFIMTKRNHDSQSAARRDTYDINDENIPVPLPQHHAEQAASAQENPRSPEPFAKPTVKHGTNPPPS